MIGTTHLILYSISSPQIPITVIWRKADGILPERSYQEHGVLTITNVQHSDSGVYICQAESDQHYDQKVTITVGSKFYHKF